MEQTNNLVTDKLLFVIAVCLIKIWKKSFTFLNLATIVGVLLLASWHLSLKSVVSVLSDLSFSCKG